MRVAETGSTLGGVSKKIRHGSTFCKADISLSSEGKAPTEIRLLKYGENESDYGPFMFDELAAALVMASFGTKGIPRLYADWNHEMMPKYPGERITREQGKAACSFVPEIRDGDLWASQIEWSEDGRADVESGHYNLFSPAFQYELGDDGVARPRKLINFALVNMAGLNGIAPLIAAMAKHEGDEMDFETLYKDTKAQLDVANTKIKTLEAQGGEVIAMSAAVGLPGGAAPQERMVAVQGLVTLRSSVLKLTGQDTPEGAIAALQAMKTNADKVVSLEAKIEADTAAKLRADLDEVWEGASKAGKLPPADRAEVEASLLDLSNGKVTEKTVAAAKTYVAKLSAVVATADNGGAARQPASGVVLSPERIAIAKQMGRNLKEVEDYERTRLGQQG